MKHSIYSKVGVGICAAFLITATSGCMEDAYNPNANKNELPPIDKVFGYETRGDVKLSIDYNAPGYQANFQIFDEDPILVLEKEGIITLKEGVKPIYSAFTTAEGKFDGTISIPTSVKEAWLYTDRLGLTRCVKMSVANGVITYDAKQVGTRSTPSNEQMKIWLGTKSPYDIIWGRADPQVETLKNMSSIVKWGANGVIKDINDTDVSVSENIGNHSVAGISERATAYITKCKKEGTVKDLLRTSEITNVTTKEDGTTLQVVFLGDAALYKNTFGYYYYKKESSFGNPSSYLNEDLTKVKKYIIFPNVSQKPNDTNGFEALERGTTVKLKFFGENNKNGVEEFPKDYVVGWFLLPQGFETDAQATNPQYSIRDAARANNPSASSWTGMMMTSNDIQGTYIDYRRFVTMFDETSKKLVIGVEDKDTDPDDYMDLTFIVTSNKDFTSDNKPIIPPVDDIEETDTQSGTLVFEDTWPNGGDYDLNDVAVKYKRTITYDKENYAKKLVEEFTFIQDEKAAENTNFFGYQFNKVNGGAVEIASDIKYEDGTSSVLISTNSLEGRNKTYTVTRTFSNQTTKVNKDDVLKDFNPYIIVTKKGTSFEEGTKQNRTEVHLPKHPATTLANTDQINTKDDIYYVNKTSYLPFAINIANFDYVLCTEKKKITDVYPKFANWASSLGKEDTNWYTDKPNN